MLLDILPLVLSLSTFAVAITAFVSGIFWVRQKQLARYRAEMAELAQRLGLSFQQNDLLGLVNQLQNFELFRRERSSFLRNGKVTNVLRGRVGDADVYMFDYTYVVSTGKSAHRVSQTVFFADNKNWYLPNFRLRPENWWHKVKDMLQIDKDINFHDQPDFSTKFYLSGEIESLIRDKFGPELRQYLTDRPPAHLEGSNYYLIAYKPNKRLNADEAEVFFENCCRLTELMQKEGKQELLNLVELKASVPLEAIKLPEKDLSEG